ncbi:unnamed protein product [Caenorhabditis brenneri]
MAAQSKPVNSDIFPFWKLPTLARSHVTRLMEQEDVIHLSMHSKPFKRLLKAFKIGGVSIKFSFWGNVPENDDFSEEWNFIETYYSSPDDSVKLWCPHPDHIRIPKNEQVLVHNNRMLVGREGKEFEVNSFLTFQEKLNTLEQITRHLLEIFHVEYFDLRYNHTNHEHIFGSFVWDVVDKFRSVSIEPFNAPDRDDISDEEERKNFDKLYGLSPEQTRFVFNEVRTDELEFQGYIFNPEELTGIQLKHRRVDVWNVDSLHWVIMDHVIDSVSEELSVRIEETGAVEVVELLKKWQSGEKLLNLEVLQLSDMIEAEHQKLSETLGKLEGVKMYSREEAEEFMKEFDIIEVEVGPFFVQRTTDGKVATFYIDDETVYFSCD